MSATDQLEQMISGGGLGVAADGAGSGGGIPTNFNAETAENDEGVRRSPPAFGAVRTAAGGERGLLEGVGALGRALEGERRG